MQSNNIKLINQFIKNCSGFWSEELKDIDNKHTNIISKFNEGYKNKIERFSRDIIDWNYHSDNGCPFQISKYHLKYFSLSSLFYETLKETYKILINDRFDKSSFMDDISIIKKTNAYDLLREFPAHSSNLRKNVYFVERNISANYRWLRYIYISNIILKKKLITNNKIWVDIGSYYGGIQGIVKSKLPNTTLVMIDFNHQLCRSYVYLKNLFPNSNHIFPNEIKSINNINEIKDGSILYVKASDFNLIKNFKVNLVTNFFSFGEMNRDSFNNYFKSELLNESENIYLINRFVSSPFFEKTYDTDINIFDYDNKNYSKMYFDIFPMHHYYKFKRKLYGRNAKRPTSSPYFEVILKNKKSS